MKHGVPEPCRARTGSEFVGLLRHLKEWSGLTYRQLELRARRQGAQLPRSTVAAALGRASLPREEVVDGIVRACGHDPDPWLEARAKLALGGAAELPGDSAPRQLPPAATALAGREAELEQLRRMLAPDAPQTRVIVISGTPGGGKSALALHAARHAAERFADGQLYVNLRGSAADARPLPPREIVARLLRGLGVRDAGVPETADEAAALLRTVVAGRSFLVLLDNAASAAQVRHLVPLGAGSTVMLTSRHRMTSLEGAAHVAVGPLSPAGAMWMLERLLGTDRVRGEPAAVARLAQLCGYLPLALRVAAARLAVRPDWPVAGLVERLQDERARLDELRVDDVEVAASLAMSYRDLTACTGRVAGAALGAFHLVGTLPGPEVESQLVAERLGLTAADADRAIEWLVEAHLLEVAGGGRYRMPDLLWLFAGQQVRMHGWQPPSRSPERQVVLTAPGAAAQTAFTN